MLCLFFISGCSLLSPKAEYIPDNKILPKAIVDKSYFFKVIILGGRVIGGKRINTGIVVPGDIGISLRNCRLPDRVITANTRDTNDHNCVEVYGTPTRTGVIKINIAGGMYGHMFAPSSEFSKDYILTVIEP